VKWKKKCLKSPTRRAFFFPIFPSTPDEFHLNLTELNIAMRFAVTTNPHGSKSKVGYPLVNIQKAIENGHRNSRFTHQKW
jgi:hypothetical protein